MFFISIQSSLILWSFGTFLFVFETFKSLVYTVVVGAAAATVVYKKETSHIYFVD